MNSNPVLRMKRNGETIKVRKMNPNDTIHEKSLQTMGVDISNEDMNRMSWIGSKCVGDKVCIR